ncbi:ubiquitin carboxyl-terminal hydrolase 47 isoform X7 [Apteryx mantelli]|uniref:Ubiquitin carboxyl-terminal hydrolase 47 n=1 Tax=Apteryx mantelli TaxID=2696672 RepID=A0ABM4EHR7_9AVES
MVPSEENQLVPKEDMFWSCRQSIFAEMKKKFSQIESAAEEPRVLCIVQDTTNSKTVNERITLNLPASTPLKRLFEDVASKVGYVNGTFDLVWGNGDNVTDMAPIEQNSDKSILDAGFESGKKNFLHLTDKDGEQPRILSEESGTTDDSTQDRFIGPLPREGSVGCTNDYVSQNYSYSSVLSKSETGYVGLVNQAMTCYLNSLLQTLFMTPEFRNALYKWEFEESEEDPVTSIPYQLQRLFVLLQTSKKRAIETTDVTRSFGWDSSEAWQQHDVQELCRVMFDALEQKWKQTEQADLINQLYQGKLKDYVRCLECGYESWRIDTYLDIPLVIRPYGSNQAFASVEEALHAFIQPEILDGPNQYFCERCKKKCDARKGLRFLHFPYLLTLQLKRFDFDYTTMHRIKLNDRMTFPEELDMNVFIDVEDEKSPQTESCTDSGAENEGSCHSDQMSNDFSNDDGVDEGICLENNSAAERISKISSEKSSLLYELFSVMVHSGSAAGGHYYACIKSFSDDQWYSFNDQHVSKITQEDIKKTYGGSSGSRGYYSSAFASSTNAYMLIYRLKDPTRNAKFLEAHEYPEHIKKLVQKERELEEQEKRQREIERNTCKIKLFCMHPIKQIMMENKLEVHKDRTLKEAVEIAYKLMDLEESVPLDCCRLVKYDEFHDYLERSYEGEEDTPMGLLLGGVKSTYMFDLLLETRRPDQFFQCYKPGEVMVKVHVVDLKTESVAPPISVRAYLNQTVLEFKQLISKATHLPAETMRVVFERCYNDLRLLNVSSKTLKAEGFFRSNKITIRLGRALKKGEYRVKVYQLLVNEPEPCKFLLDAVFAKGMTVRQSKEELLPQLREQCGLDLTIDRFRLRKKTWKNPGTVFLDYHVYEEDINISSNWEVFLEILDGVEKMKSMSQLAVLSRRWRPSEMKLDSFQEVVLESSSVEELREKLSEISGIPLENIDFAKGRGTFPCDISILEIHQDLDWNPKVSTLNVWPLYICDDGAVIFYRDKTEELMELTEEQRNELMKKESSRLQKTGHRVTYSPRKEKALKIYLDGAPNKDLTQD